MITLDTFGVVTLMGIIVSVVINIIQYQKQRQMKKETLRPIYNGLIGLFNDVKNKGTHCHRRQNLLFARDNPYNTVEALKRNFYEFIIETISHFESLREHIVPILKTVDPSEESVFKGADFGITDKEKEVRKKFDERWQIQQEIDRRRLTEELEQLKSTKRSNTKDSG